MIDALSAVPVLSKGSKGSWPPMVLRDAVLRSSRNHFRMIFLSSFGESVYMQRASIVAIFLQIVNVCLDYPDV